MIFISFFIFFFIEYSFLSRSPGPEEPMAEGMRIIEEAAKLHGV